MALIRLRECICTPNETYQRLDAVPENLKESVNRLSSRLKESTINVRQEVDSAIAIAERLRESAMPGQQALFDKVIKSLKENGSTSKSPLWKFPIARVNDKDHLNGNNRVYGRRLWKNVINNQRDSWYQMVGLADHPKAQTFLRGYQYNREGEEVPVFEYLDDDPGEIKNAAIVWLDMFIEGDLIYGVGRFVGDYGRLAQEIIEAGGKIGFSSDGFGEVMDDGITVNPDTYYIERPADIVLNPSQSVFGSAGSENNIAQGGTVEYDHGAPKGTMRESVSDRNGYTSRILQYQNNQRGKMTMENTVDAVKLQESVAGKTQQKYFAKAEEKAFRKYVEAFMNDASNIKNPTKRLTEMTEILGVFEDGYCQDLKESVQNKLLEEREKLEKLVESAVKLQEDFEQNDLDKLNENAQIIGQKAMVLKDMNADYEKLCEGLTNHNRKLIKENRALTFKLQCKEDAISRLEEKVNISKVSSNSQSAKLLQENAGLKKTVESLKEEVAKLTKGNRIFEKKLGIAETSLREANKKLAESRLAVSNANKSGEGNVAELAKLKEENETLTRAVALLEKRNQTLKESAAKKERAESDKIAAEIKQFKEDANQHDYKSQIKKSFSLREGEPIQNYWNQQFKKYGDKIVPFKEAICRAKTLKEAQWVVLNNLEKIDEGMGVADAMWKANVPLPKSERERLMESAGVPKDVAASTSKDDKAALYQKQAEMFGLN